MRCPLGISFSFVSKIAKDPYDQTSGDCRTDQTGQGIAGDKNCCGTIRTADNTNGMAHFPSSCIWKMFPRTTPEEGASLGFRQS